MPHAAPLPRSPHPPAPAVSAHSLVPVSVSPVWLRLIIANDPILPWKGAPHTPRGVPRPSADIMHRIVLGRFRFPPALCSALAGRSASLSHICPRDLPVCHDFVHFLSVPSTAAQSLSLSATVRPYVQIRGRLHCPHRVLIRTGCEAVSGSCAVRYPPQGGRRRSLGSDVSASPTRHLPPPRPHKSSLAPVRPWNEPVSLRIKRYRVPCASTCLRLGLRAIGPRPQPRPAARHQ